MIQHIGVCERAISLYRSAEIFWNGTFEIVQNYFNVVCFHLVPMELFK